MQNDFEKQVRQKMDELDFVPSAPVWTKVEEQIRKKKERRRLILWLPLFAALLVGGGLLLNNNMQKENAVAAVKEATDSDKTTNYATEQPTTKAVTTETNTIETTTADKPNAIQQNNTNTGVDVLKSDINNDKSSVVVKEQKTYLPKKREAKLSTATNGNDDTKQTTIAAGTVNDGTEVKPPAEKLEKGKATLVETKLSAPQNNLWSDNPTGKEGSDVQQNDTAGVNQNKEASPVTADSASKTNTEKKKQASKWKYAVAFMTGSSNVGEGISLGSEKMAMDVMNAGVGTTPSFSGTPGTSEIKKGFAFSIGANAKKALTKKIAFTTGLHYNYYSNTLLAGQDSSGYVRFYSAFTNAVQNSYRNSYHFISVPVGFDIQLLNKIPLGLYAGLSLQQLVASKALVYNNASRAYVNDKSALTKTQLFSQLGLGYSVKLKKSELRFGPQVNYGFSKLEKNSDKHLVSIGFHTQFVF